jgi:hypothetical protein
MFKTKKFIFIALLTIAVLGAVLGGVAIAQADEVDTAQATIWDRIASIFQRNTGVAIDPAELQKAADEAQQQLRDEAQDAMIDRMVEAGRLTEEQAAGFKAWLDARPEQLTEEYKTWLESRPDGVPFGPMMRGRFGGFGGMFNRGGRGGCFQDLPVLPQIDLR